MRYTFRPCSLVNERRIYIIPLIPFVFFYIFVDVFIFKHVPTRHCYYNQFIRYFFFRFFFLVIPIASFSPFLFLFFYSNLLTKQNALVILLLPSNVKKFSYIHNTINQLMWNMLFAVVFVGGGVSEVVVVLFTQIKCVERIFTQINCVANRALKKIIFFFVSFWSCE